MISYPHLWVILKEKVYRRRSWTYFGDMVSMGLMLFETGFSKALAFVNSKFIDSSFTKNGWEESSGPDCRSHPSFFTITDVFFRMLVVGFVFNPLITAITQLVYRRRIVAGLWLAFEKPSCFLSIDFIIVGNLLLVISEKKNFYENKKCTQNCFEGKVLSIWELLMVCTVRRFKIVRRSIPCCLIFMSTTVQKNKLTPVKSYKTKWFEMKSLEFFWSSKQNLY